MRKVTVKQVHDSIYFELEDELWDNDDALLSSSESTIRIDAGDRVILVKIEEERSKQ